MRMKQSSPKIKLQVVLEDLSGERTPGQIAKQNGIHANSVGLWKKEFLERGAEVFAQDGAGQQCGRHLAELEQLLGKKEVEIALPVDFFPQEHRQGVGRNRRAPSRKEHSCASGSRCIPLPVHKDGATPVTRARQNGS